MDHLTFKLITKLRFKQLNDDNGGRVYNHCIVALPIIILSREIKELNCPKKEGN